MKDNVVIKNTYPATGIHIECQELEFCIGGIRLKADLPSLDYVDEIEINGIKFVRCK